MSKPRVLIVNDRLTCIPNTKTLWHWLVEWFDALFIHGNFETLASHAEHSITSLVSNGVGVDLIIRNGTYFPWFTTCHRPVISLMQDIQHGHLRDWQRNVGANSDAVVFNSKHTAQHESFFAWSLGFRFPTIIPLGVDFDFFRPIVGTVKKYDVCWVGSSNPVKGWDRFNSIVAACPNLKFACVTKDGARIDAKNVTNFANLPQSEMLQVYNASRIGLCTSEQETQHLAGIEMAACGVPMVAPAVGAYHHAVDGWAFVAPLNHLSRMMLFLLETDRPLPPGDVRDSARKAGLSLDACKTAWVNLVAEVLDAKGK